MTQDEIFGKLRTVLVDALGVDEEEVTMEARLTTDLHAESIDFLDIVFRIEKAFGFKIGQGELFPDNINDPKYVQDGVVNAAGLALLRERMPHVDFSEFAKNPKLEKVSEIFTVASLVSFVAAKLNAGTASSGAAKPV
ncbi:MAG: acyl carrier protein [Planctomycetes bacterium]|nr:acyl carrier protein [Planctomycetota bacterium]